MKSAIADKLVGECPELHQISAAPGPSMGPLPSLQIMMGQGKNVGFTDCSVNSDYRLRIRDKNEEENDGKDELKHTHTLANMKCL